jgi:hypothetical protein
MVQADELDLAGVRRRVRARRFLSTPKLATRSAQNRDAQDSVGLQQTQPEIKHPCAAWAGIVPGSPHDYSKGDGVARAFLTDQARVRDEISSGYECDTRKVASPAHGI